MNHRLASIVLLFSIVSLAISVAHLKPVAQYGRDLSHNFVVDPNFMTLVASDAGYLYTGSAQFLVSQYRYPETKQDFTPKNLITLPPKGTHISRLGIQVTTDEDGSDILAITASHAIQDNARWGPCTSRVYQFTNATNVSADENSDVVQPMVELCTIPDQSSWYTFSRDMVMDGKRRKLYYQIPQPQPYRQRPGPQKLNITSLVSMRDELTGQVAPCPSVSIELPAGSYHNMIYDSKRDVLLLLRYAYPGSSILLVHGTTGAMLGTLILNEVIDLPREIKLDTASSILYCLVTSHDPNADAIYAYDISDFNSIRLANIYPYPIPFRVAQMEVDNKLGVLHVTSHGPIEANTPTLWHWSSIASDRHAMVMNITITNIKVNQFVIHNSELGFYGRRTHSWNDAPCFHRFAFEYDRANATGSSKDIVDLGVVF